MKPIKGYEGRYSITEDGKVFIHDFIRIDGRKFPAKFKKTQIRIDGYEVIGLTKNGKNKLLFVHRLVAETFLPHLSNLNIVNHLDGNRKNNKIENLEWTTSSGNSQHAFRVLGRKQWNEGKHIKTNNALENYFITHDPWNKGKKIGYIPKMAFKKGHIPWNKK